MDDLFTPVSQVYISKQREKPATEEVGEREPKKPAPESSLSSFADTLEVLRNEPNYEALSSVLELLSNRTCGDGKKDSIHSPSPQNAQIVQTLVTEIVPNYWRLLKEEDEASAESSRTEAKQNISVSPFRRLLTCLQSLSGVNAILTHLRGILGELDSIPDETRRSHTVLSLELFLELLCSLLEERDAVRQIWENTAGGLESTSSMSKPLAQELVNVIGGGRIVSLAAQAERIVRKKTEARAEFWVAGSKNYSSWLVQNIISWARKNASDCHVRLRSDLLAKAFRLGHFDLVVRTLVETLLVQDSQDGPDVFNHLFTGLPSHEQKRVLHSVLKYSSDTLFDGISIREPDSSFVAAVSGLINMVVDQVEARRTLLMTWLTDSAGAAPGEPIGIRRAVLALVAQRRDDVTLVLEKCLAQFGDQLYIRHAPLLQQEAHAQVLLLSAGYVHRANPIKLALLAKSSSYLNAISNRLGAPQTRARVLGMIVGETLSGLTKTGGKGLDFDMGETKDDEAMWYKSLVDVNDSIGSVESLRNRLAAQRPPSSEKKAARGSQPKLKTPPKPKKPVASAQSAKPVIMEVEDSDEEEDDDLVPYAKPDSDPEDSEDDAELVRRDKPRAPVYIRDLIAYLRDSENYDRQKLGLTTAPLLIRRKANYGTEVTDHAEELATLLVGLQDKYDIDDFANLRIQGMVAVFVAQPQKMGPWFARTFFNGDYSLAQRASVLTVLGLGARELAGYETSEYAESAAFPSKRLPENVELLYLDQTNASEDSQSASSLKALPSNAIDGIARSITKTFLAPMAAEAADVATGPDALKLSSFTSRLQQKQAAEASSSGKKARVRAIPNTTAQLISTAVFFPLTARFQVALRSSSTASAGVVAQPELLSHLLRTLGLLVHAAGPSTLSLPGMTAELWGLLLQVRARCSGDLGVTRAVMFALLALLDVNGAGGEARMRDVCRDLAREVVETQEWVTLVFERTRGGDGAAGEEDEVKMLAAGVLIRLREAMEKFRAFMIGDMIG